MLSFLDWASKKESVERFKYNAADNMGSDYERVTKELFKLVLSKYPDETHQFLSSIAQHGDKEVSDLISQMSGSSIVPHHSREYDEVMPSPSDRGGNVSGV